MAWNKIFEWVTAWGSNLHLTKNLGKLGKPHDLPGIFFWNYRGMNLPDNTDWVDVTRSEVKTGGGKGNQRFPTRTHWGKIPIFLGVSQKLGGKPKTPQNRWFIYGTPLFFNGWFGGF